MSLPGEPVALFPRGVSDTLAGDTAPAGMMAQMVNLIPDASTRSLWQCRPAAVILNNIANLIPSPNGFISVVLVIGTRLYGMISSTTFPGRDQPFCFDIQANLLVPITGMTQQNLPGNAPAAGPWTPPQMTLCGSKIIISHPGYVGGAGAFFGVIDTLHQNALTYTGTNTAPVALIFPPSFVLTFNGRVFFLVNPPGQQPAAYMSDSLNATSITNANQILTFGDNVALTCAGRLGLSNQVIGGVVQAIMIFKGLENMYQVTGDYALGNLAVNVLNSATGTLAPNSLTSTEKGLMFTAPDGIRLIDFDGNVDDPIGADGQGVTIPFYNILNPSRACAAYNNGIYRIQLQNGAVPGNPQQEWWYDSVRQVWSGPHTTAVSLIIAYQNTFILTRQTSGGKIFRSDTVQTYLSTFVEDTFALKWLYQTSTFPDDSKMCEFCNIEATLHMQLPPSSNLGNPWSSGWSSGFGPGDAGHIQVKFMDQNFTVLDTVFVNSRKRGSLWGVFKWGVDDWGGAADNLYPRRLSWHFPIVFRRGIIQANGLSSSQLKIGEVRMRIQDLGYLQQDDDNTFPASGPFVLDKSKLGGANVLG